MRTSRIDAGPWRRIWRARSAGAAGRAAALLAGLLACRTDATEPAAGLGLTVAVDQRAFVVGDTLRVMVTAVNTTGAPVALDGARCASALAFRVLDAAGRAVMSSTDWMELCMGPPPAPLAPGDSVVARFVWTGRQGEGGPRTAGTSSPLVAPGAYGVVGLFRARGAAETITAPLTVHALTP